MTLRRRLLMVLIELLGQVIIESTVSCLSEALRSPLLRAVSLPTSGIWSLVQSSLSVQPCGFGHGMDYRTWQFKQEVKNY